MEINNKNILYFIGIGGVGMSALASLCLEEGHQVYGYDRTPSDITNQLITYHNTENQEVAAWFLA